MEINKVVYNGDTLLDLTSDTVTPQTLLSGATAHAANGQSISGTVDLNGKADKVANATAGHFAGLDSNGNLTDSNKSAADFATASDMAAVQGVIPSTATTSNKLATASDVSGEDISSTSTTSPVTDSADGYVQGITVKGHSEKSKNLFNPDNVINAYISGEAIITSDPNSRIIYASCLPNTTYTVSKKAGQRFNVCTTESVPQAGMSVNQIITGIGTNTSATLTTNSSAKYIVAYVYNANSDTGTATEMLGTCQIEEGSTATDYEPYFDGIKSIGDAGWGVVDLGTLTWTKPENKTYFTTSGIPTSSNETSDDVGLCSKYNIVPLIDIYRGDSGDKTIGVADTRIYALDTTYTNATAFKSAMSGVLLYYRLADTTGATPILGITSNNGAGQGTSATITTGLPLRSISDSITDELTETKVVKNCAEIDLSEQSWTVSTLAPTDFDEYYCRPAGIAAISESAPAMICDTYNVVPRSQRAHGTITVINNEPGIIFICITKGTNPNTITGNLVYPLATPTETPLTSAEKSAFRGLRTYDSTTNIAITDSPEFELDYIKNTDNGQAVADIQRDLQEQINDKITVSPSLTLTVAGWNSTTLQQTVTFVHDTTKRNVIDVDPASVEEWAACGIIARYETASSITFTCKSIPENALSFKVTSMGV